MMRYYITHTDQHGEKHQLPGAWEGRRPDDAVARMLRESQSLDDGMWEAHAIIEAQQ
jgi:hypothetical protein